MVPLQTELADGQMNYALLAGDQAYYRTNGFNTADRCPHGQNHFDQHARITGATLRTFI